MGAVCGNAEWDYDAEAGGELPVATVETTR